MIRRTQRKPPRMLRLLLLSASAFASACGSSRTVFINAGDVVRIGPDVVGRVYTLGADGVWTLSGDEVQLPEGWYCVALEPEELEP